MRTFLRVVFGFIWASIVAGIVTVLFIETPVEIAQLSGIPMLEKITDLTILALRVATHSAIFSAAFALIAILIAEWAHMRNWLYYAATGMMIAALGLLLQYSSEVTGQPTIINNYALLTYFTTGFLGGFAYWLFAGRRAGGYQADPEFTYIPTETTVTSKRSGADTSREATAEIRETKKEPPPPKKTDAEGTKEKDRATSVPITSRPADNTSDA